jgi:phenylacetate-CoA ligase
MTANWERVYREAGVTPADRLFFAFSFGPFLGFWTAFDASTKLGCLSIPGGGMNSLTRLQTIIANGVTVLLCTPTYAIHLAEVAQREKIDLSQTSVRSIIVAGEPGGSIAANRRCISESWGGVRVFDQHGMTEAGPVSFESIRTPGVLHVIETSYFAEVIDPQTRNPIHEGEVGELVLTPLGRVGSPLLRYRTGDLVRPVWSETGEHGGAGMVLEGGILGRTDDMVIIRGVNVSPSAVEDVIHSIPGIGEYRVEVRSEQGMLEMRVFAEPSPEVTDPGQIARDLEGRFRTAFNLRIPVETVPYGSLPRFEMKAKRWIHLSTEATHG